MDVLKGRYILVKQQKGQNITLDNIILDKSKNTSKKLDQMTVIKKKTV